MKLLREKLCTYIRPSKSIIYKKKLQIFWILKLVFSLEFDEPLMFCT